MTIKLSECGFPRRRLWVTLKSIAASLNDLVSTLANHQEILAPCPNKCRRHQAFIRTYMLSKYGNKFNVYSCMGCGWDIDVEMDQSEFGG